MKKLLRFFKDDSGVSMMEYALIGSLVAVAAIGAFTGLGTSIGDSTNDIANNL